MSQVHSGFTKQMARNMFYGGTVFFALLFAALIFDSERRIPERSNAHAITPAVVAGKKVWETNNCIGCHTLLGEGAYFAPELGNVYKRRGPDFIKAWMASMPSNTPGRRQMPQFNLTEEQTNNLIEFLKWTGEINTENWPPNIEG
ncbi:nitric oxide reductase, NorC subunit apoprotein [Paenacidovorax caeni]|jgi:nitric oxide reductase subunit C|uniref:Nitric oxide reductase, NorC subunit apoprotein n=1 Tax=Paenacidovorax caeni TaxID=343013 RepID=A0A1I7HRS1_9BURK|nr:cytochrome c [Paenacidovorax caeni]SFU63341.1 nitric oxide reductase, NorC subunit apoprotein [Paenacidovorax caeni]